MIGTAIDVQDLIGSAISASYCCGLQVFQSLPSTCLTITCLQFPNYHLSMACVFFQSLPSTCPAITCCIFPKFPIIISVITQASNVEFFSLQCYTLLHCALFCGTSNSGAIFCIPNLRYILSVYAALLAEFATHYTSYVVFNT